MKFTSTNSRWPYFVSVTTVAIVSVLAVNYFILAWTAPSSNPPDGSISGIDECTDCDTSFVNEGQAGSINSSMIVDGTIGSADIDSSQVQRRVTTSCAGQVMVGINADGSAACEPDNTGSGGTVSCGWSGWYPTAPSNCLGDGWVCGTGDCVAYERFTHYCSGGVLTNTQICGCWQCQRNSCFAAGTEVLMADGTSKLIEDVQIGDRLAGAHGYNTVLAFDRPLLTYEKDQRLMAINGSEFFITDNHPVMTTAGWKAYYPESAKTEAWDVLHDKISRLNIGDKILKADGNVLEVESIELKAKSEEPRKLYNFVLDGDHTYYANGLLVIGFVPDQAGRFPIENEHVGE